MIKAGIIAGSGFYKIDGVKVIEERTVTTPYGRPSDVYRICEFSGKEFAFIARHGSPHRLPPHKVNYRANIWGFKDLGVERILSVNAVGGINRMLQPGDIVIADQVIDMTHGRESTFYDGPEVVHIDFTMPYCPELRGSLFEAGRKNNIPVRESATYLSSNGPRLESKAEISFYSQIGGDIVGMTGMPEASLAREIELCFAKVCVVTNYAAGISEEKLTVTEVVDTMKVSTQKVKTLLMETLDIIPAQRSCDCSHALKDARM